MQTLLPFRLVKRHQSATDIEGLANGLLLNERICYCSHNLTALIYIDRYVRRIHVFIELELALLHVLLKGLRFLLSEQM